MPDIVGYNLSAIGNATNVLSLTQNVNDVLMEGQFGTLFLIGIAVVMFMGFLWSTRDAPKSLATTCFICFLLSTLLLAMNLVQAITPFICLVGAAFSIAFIKAQNNP